jgi:hypothetical protein
MKEQTARSTMGLFGLKSNPDKARELTTQGIKRSLQALVKFSFSGFGVQAAFLCTLLSFGRFDLQSGNFVVQLSDFSLQTQILSGKIV